MPVNGFLMATTKFNFEQMPPELRALTLQVDQPEYGFFGPDSQSWRVGRESSLLFTGYRALLLQLAHPKIAQAVAEHSRFAGDPLVNAVRLYASLGDIIFGSRDKALQTIMHARNVLEGVHGTLTDENRLLARGSRYRANDPEVLFWVNATLFDSVIRGYELIAEPLSSDEKERHYKENRLFAQLFGVPTSAMPETYDDFEAYFEGTLALRLDVTPTSRELCRALFSRNLQARAAAPLNQLLTAGMLPRELREAYGLPWGPGRKAAFTASLRALRLARRTTLPPLRYVHFYHQAMLRIYWSRLAQLPESFLGGARAGYDPVVP